MNKRFYGVLYISSFIISITIIVVLSSIYLIEEKITMPIFVTLGVLFSHEIQAKLNNTDSVWKYFSNSTRDKISYAVSLTIWFILIIWGIPENIPFLGMLLHLVIGYVVSMIVLLISVRPETRLVILHRLFSRKKL